MDRCPNAILLDVDDASAEKLKTLAPAAFVFMSSKDIYLLRDKLEKNLIRVFKDTCRLLKKPIPFYKGIGFLFCLDRRSEIISYGKTLT